jgi:hypothetical protein
MKDLFVAVRMASFHLVLVFLEQAQSRMILILYSQRHR